jgi:hypothetical protein
VNPAIAPWIGAAIGAVICVVLLVRQAKRRRGSRHRR